MVRLTRSVVLQGISKVSIDKRDTLEVDKEFGRITHLHLQRKNISTLDSLHLFTSLTVLYLYENEIERIQGLEQAHNLEILHLQRNRLNRIENLHSCTQLRKLYLGYNEIEIIEGLHTLTKLEELHVEHQHLRDGMSLTFDPKSLSCLSMTLIVLNISGDNINHLEDFAGMEELHTLIASNNAITDLDSASLVVRSLVNLQVLDLWNNPISRRPQFKERIIGYGTNIRILNDKMITDNTRTFIKRFAAVKASRLQLSVDAYKKSRSNILSSEIIPAHPRNTICGGTGDTSSAAPVKSNLRLDLSNSTATFLAGRRGMVPSPIQSVESVVETETYLSSAPRENPYANRAKSSMPQFILAPPNFQISSMSLNRGNRKGYTNIGVLRRRSISIPAFKQKPAGNPEVIQTGALFSASKIRGDMWTGSRSMHQIKAPKPVSGSEESLTEGTPKACGAEMTESLMPEVQMERSRVSPGMIHEEFDEPPPFITSVYELPPWPHIVRRWAVEKPAVSFMP